MRFSIPAAVVSFALCLAPGAQAYTTKSTPRGIPVRWPVTSLSIALEDGGISAEKRALLDAAAAGAMSAWNGAGAMQLGTAVDSAGPDITVRWETGPWASAKDELAVTALAYDKDSGAIQKATIRVNDRFAWVSGDAGEGGQLFDLQSTLTHELGHALGLGHTPVSTASMYYSTTLGERGQRTLDPDDVEGLRSIYGAESSVSAAEAAFGCSSTRAEDSGAPWCALALALAAICYSAMRRSAASASAR